MTRVVLAARIRDDFARFLRHMAEYDVPNGPAHIRQIIDAIDILADRPRLGRPVEAGLREAILGKRSRGYIALYLYAEASDTVLVIAIRHQSEGGYPRNG